MARRGWSTSNFLRYAAALATVEPVTIACWAKTSITGSAQIMGGIFASGSASNRNNWQIGLDSTNHVTAAAAGSGAIFTAATTTTISANTWFHACGVFAASNDRRAFLNGGGKGTQASNSTPGSLNRTSVGVADSSSAATPFAPAGTGDIAEFAIWNVAFTDAEVALLATGISPLLVHPGNLVGYWPLVGRTSPEINYVDSTAVLTMQGTVTASDHSRVVLPRKTKLRSVAGGAVTISADANSSGTGTAAGGGAAIWDSVGAATGAASVSGTSGATKGSPGSSAGVGTATGVSGATAGSVASTSGVATAASLGAAIWDSLAASAGVGAATGLSAEILSSIAAASGVGTATSVSGSTDGSVASSTGTGSATGVSGSIKGSVGSTSGIATAAAAATDAALVTNEAIAHAAGVGTALGIGASRRLSRAQATGSSTAQAQGQNAGQTAVAHAAGTSTATAQAERNLQPASLYPIWSGLNTGWFNGCEINGAAPTEPIVFDGLTGDIIPVHVGAVAGLYFEVLKVRDERRTIAPIAEDRSLRLSQEARLFATLPEKRSMRVERSRKGYP